jgi:hypothetical protein
MLFVFSGFLALLVFLPTLVGAVLAVIFKRPRSDALALLVSLILMMISHTILPAHDLPWLVVDPLRTGEIDTATLIAGVVAAVSLSLIGPFVLARFGIYGVDYFRNRHHATLRHESKGNLVLSILFGVAFVSCIAQVIPSLIETSVPAYYQGRQEALQRHEVEHKQK